MKRTEPPEIIWLVPDADYEDGWLWCDCPAPGLDMDEAEAVRYIKAPEPQEGGAA